MRILLLLLLSFGFITSHAQMAVAPGAAPTAGPATSGAATTAATNIQGPMVQSGGVDQSAVTDAQATADTSAPEAQRVRASLRQSASQFQLFVQETTGQKLSMFGSALFDNPSSYATDTSQPAPGDYVLGSGDEIHMQVWGAVEFTGVFTIDRNGQIAIPKVGTVNLAGVQVRNLEGVLHNYLSSVFTNFNLNANLGRLRSIQVYVVGQALRPGTLKVSSLSTLVNALFVSGGPSANGSMRNIQLKRGGKALLERIAPEQTPPRRVQDVTIDPVGLKHTLRDGDVLTVLGISPAFGNAVTLQGTVAAPLRYTWFEGMKILDLLPERDALITADYYRRKNLLLQSADAAQDAGPAWWVGFAGWPTRSTGNTP